jgi:hypothetical protein
LEQEPSEPEPGAASQYGSTTLLDITTNFINPIASYSSILIFFLYEYAAETGQYSTCVEVTLGYIEATASFTSFFCVLEIGLIVLSARK